MASNLRRQTVRYSGLSVPNDATVHTFMGIRGGTCPTITVPWTNPTSTDGCIVEVGVSFDGVDPTKSQVLVEVYMSNNMDFDGNPPAHHTIVKANTALGSDGVTTYYRTYPLNNDGNGEAFDWFIGHGGVANPGHFGTEPSYDIAGPSWYQNPALGAPFVMSWPDDEGPGLNSSFEGWLVRLTNPTTGDAGLHATLWMTVAA